MIDIAVVLIYLIVVLVVGLFSGIRIRSVEEYSISKNSFTTFVLIAAIFATLVGGGATMGVSEKTFSTGLIFSFSCLGFIIRDLLTAVFVAPKIHKFAGCYTAGEIIEKYYGKNARIFVGLAGALQTNAILSMQVAALGHLMNYFFGISYSLGVVIGIGIVVLYSSFGGIRAVTFTDVIQFCVLIVAIPITFFMSLETVGGYYGLFNSLPAQKLNLLPTSGDSFRFFTLFFVFCIPYMCPALLQRMLMGKNTIQIRQALIISALGRFPYLLMVSILGLVAFVLEPNLKADLAFPYLVNQILPVGIKGFVIAGLLAVIMSTADSYLHLTGLMFCHDVVKPILKNPLSDKQELFLLRIFTLAVGSCSVFGAFFNTNIIELNIFSYVFWLPSIFLPLFCILYGIHASRFCFFTSAFFGISTYLIWKMYFFSKTSIDSLVPAVLINTLIFFTIWAFEKKKLSFKLKAA